MHNSQESNSTPGGAARRAEPAADMAGCNLVLIGYRGTGKTTVARELARRLGWEWVDADVEVELRAGLSIAEIFAARGEEAFRDLESRVLAELAPRRRLVLAAGGGAVLRGENRALLRQCGRVIWLKAEPATLWKRIQSDAATEGRRPRLTSRGGEAEIMELLAQRTPLYQECADLAVDTEGKSAAQVAQEIVAALPTLPLPKREPS